LKQPQTKKTGNGMTRIEKLIIVVLSVLALSFLGYIVGPPKSQDAAQAVPAVAKPDPAQVIRELNARAVAMPYDQIARDPGKYQGAIVVFEGKVVQALESGQNLVLRVDVAPNVDISDPNFRISGDIVYVDYRKNHPDETRILEGDKVRLWGKYVGIYSYKAVLGQTIQIPHVVAQIVEDQGRYVRPSPQIRGR
jgi:hypothetical protein